MFGKVIVLFALIMICSKESDALTALYINDIEQAEISSAVVIAHIGASRVIETEKGLRTKVAISIEEVITGKAPNQVEVILFGGKKKDEVVDFSGNARLEEGEYCVLFLLERDGLWYLTALQQSKLHIVENEDKELILEREISQHLVYPSEEGLITYEEYQPSPTLTLKEFRKQIQRVRE